MKITRIVLIISYLGGLVHAEIARKMNIGEFSKMIENSPFTLKPVEQVNSAVQESELKDWMLAGISPLQDGYFVTLRNKKDLTKEVIIAGSEEVEGFKIEKVEFKEKPTESSVVVSYRGKPGQRVGFDISALGIPSTIPNQIVNPAGGGAQASQMKGSSAPQPDQGGAQANRQGQPSRNPNTVPTPQNQMPIPGMNPNANSSGNRNANGGNNGRRPRVMIPSR